MTAPQRCNTCRYWRRDDHTLEKGRCQIWPMTIEKRGDEWCGQWQDAGVPKEMEPISMASIANRARLWPGEDARR